MKTYEMLYVVDASADEEAKDAIQKKFEGVVAETGGNVVSAEKLGTKKLTYPIKFKKEGSYFLLTYESDGSGNKELDRVASLTQGVLRRMITVKEVKA